MSQRDSVVGGKQPLTKPEFPQTCAAAGDGTCIITIASGETFLIDAVDAERVMALFWCAQHRDHTIRFMAHMPGHRAPVQIGRLIAGSGPHEIADHINGDATDNRRANLRSCSHSQNSANSHLQVGKRIRFKGVTEHRPGRFRATARHAGKFTHLGTAETAEAAAHLYDQFAREHFGDFARLNFPKTGERSALREVVR